MAGWTPKDYTQFFLFDEPTHTPKEIRAEYSRMRDIAVKRAKRLEKAGLTAQAQYLLKLMPKVSDISNKEEIGKRLSQGRATLYNEKAYSLKGIKEIQKRINDETGEIIPLGEVLSFADYMKSWRLSAFSSLVVPSGEAASLHSGEYQEIGGSFADFYTLYKQGI